MSTKYVAAVATPALAAASLPAKKGKVRLLRRCIQPGEEADNLQGGVAGGSISEGVLRVGDEIEIRPGIISKDAKGNMQCR